MAGAGAKAIRRAAAAASAIVIGLFAASPASADEDAQALAKKLVNPLADLISMPFQGNWNEGIGPEGKGTQSYVNVQPVVPIHLNEDWNLISRTILPVISQNDVFPGAGSQLGLGNTQQSLFFSPVKPTNGIIWGVGPILYLPTNTNDLLGPDKWGVGPTGVALIQNGPWTAGILANQIWSVAGDPDDTDVNQAYLQPFLSYTTPEAWTFSLNSESTYDWLTDEWSVPVNAMVSKLTKLGGQPVSLQVGARYWLVSPDDVGPSNWGARFNVTFLFPEK